jgi:hypothetical protein
MMDIRLTGERMRPRKRTFLTEDRDEIVSLMEPLLLGPRHREHLTDLTLDLARKSSAFRASLPASILRSLSVLVRSMNCYYPKKSS